MPVQERGRKRILASEIDRSEKSLSLCPHTQVSTGPVSLQRAKRRAARASRVQNHPSGKDREDVQPKTHPIRTGDRIPTAWRW